MIELKMMAETDVEPSRRGSSGVGVASRLFLRTSRRFRLMARASTGAEAEYVQVVPRPRHRLQR
jgi:hypothetical protein